MRSDGGIAYKTGVGNLFSLQSHTKTVIFVKGARKKKKKNNLYSFSQVILILIVVVFSCTSQEDYEHMSHVQLSPHTHIHQSIGAGKISTSCLSSFQPF